MNLFIFKLNLVFSNFFYHFQCNLAHSQIHCFHITLLFLPLGVSPFLVLPLICLNTISLLFFFALFCSSTMPSLSCSLAVSSCSLSLSTICFCCFSTAFLQSFLTLLKSGLLLLPDGVTYWLKVYSYCKIHLVLILK